VGGGGAPGLDCSWIEHGVHFSCSGDDYLKGPAASPEWESEWVEEARPPELDGLCGIEAEAFSAVNRNRLNLLSLYSAVRQFSGV
jgi:hypothetical protein